MRNSTYVLAGVVVLSLCSPVRAQCTGNNLRLEFQSGGYGPTPGYGPYSQYSLPSATYTNGQTYGSMYQIPCPNGYSLNQYPQRTVFEILPNGTVRQLHLPTFNGYSVNYGNGYQGGPSYDLRLRSPY
jgi:hypothetical protein